LASEHIIVALVLVLAAPTIAAAQSAPEPAPVPAPAAESVPSPAPAVAPTPVAKPADPPPRPDAPFEYSLGFEVGYGQTADTSQLYGNGYGKTLVLGFSTHYELRFLESYDLEDRSGMFDADRAHGQLGITSLGYRINMPMGAFAVRPLLGLAWMRRPSLRSDPDDVLEALTVRSQHGLAAMVGGGIAIRFGHLAVSADVRLYPTWWQSINGTRATVNDDTVMYTPVAESPGGIPRTITVALTLGM